MKTLFNAFTRATAILIALFVQTKCADYGEPRPDELERAVTVKAPLNWGNQIKKDHSIRLLCIGGSNSHCVGDNKYPERLDVFLKSNLSTDSYAFCEGE